MDSRRGEGRVGRTLRLDGARDGLCLELLVEEDDSWRW